MPVPSPQRPLSVYRAVTPGKLRLRNEQTACDVSSQILWYFKSSLTPEQSVLKSPEKDIYTDTDTSVLEDCLVFHLSSKPKWKRKCVCVQSCSADSLSAWILRSTSVKTSDGLQGLSPTSEAVLGTNVHSGMQGLHFLKLCNKTLGTEMQAFSWVHKNVYY